MRIHRPLSGVHTPHPTQPGLAKQPEEDEASPEGLGVSVGAREPGCLPGLHAS